MGAVGKQRIKRLISQIGDIEDVHGEGSVDTFKSLAISEDGSNIVATDASGGATTFSLSLPATSNTGLTLNGTDGKMTVPKTAPLTDALTAWTWWVEFTPNEEENKHIMMFGGLYIYYFGATTKILRATARTSIHPSPGKYLYTSDVDGEGATITPLNVDTKNQIAMTYDGVTFKLYWNGVLVDSEPMTGDTLYYGYPYLGYFLHYSGGDDFTEAQISGLAMFDGALDIEDLAGLNAGTTTPSAITTATAKMWLQFLETSNTTAADSIGSHPGTIAGTYSWDSAAESFTLANPSGLESGRTYRWLIETGGLRTCTFGSKFISEGAASLQISQGAGKKDMIVGTVSNDGSQIYCSIRKDLS